MPIPDAVHTLTHDLRAIFGTRLHAVVLHGVDDAPDTAPTTTLALVEDLSPDDLRACADRVRSWHDAGLATPLMLTRGEFARSLDAFPFEFGAILADHVVVAGTDPFAGLRIDTADLRRACEVQVRSHLLHLREGYIETEGRSDALADLIQRSAAPLAALLRNLGRLNEDSPADGVLAGIAQLERGRRMSSDEARSTFPRYLAAVEHLATVVDGWGTK